MLRVATARASLAMVLSLVIWSMLPLLAGWTPRVILSGSMEPRVHVGDIVVTRTVPGENLAKGQVITVTDPDHPEKTRTHRVLRREDDGTLVLKGDANQSADSTPVSVDDVHGVGVIRVPFVGRPAYWMAEHNWLALGATTLFLGWCLVTVLPSSRRSKDTSGDDTDRPVPPAPRHSRPRRIAATVAVAAISVGAAGPADAAFRGLAPSPASTWSAAATFVVSYSQTGLADSPQFYWRLNESSGSSLTSGTAFSVETWIRTTRTTGGGLVSLISGSGPERSLYMGNDGKVRFGRSGTALVTSPQALSDGAWHHVVYTNTGSGTTRARLYVDGSLVAQGPTGVTVSATGNWRAGQAQWNTSWAGSPDQFFRGDLDEVAVYGRALTALEVSEHFGTK